jgi:CCR4-NOT transcription complex subunit 6
MCYNVLCDKYATRQMYGYCPSWALEWEYMKKGILDEIRHYAADIISLQVSKLMNSFQNVLLMTVRGDFVCVCVSNFYAQLCVQVGTAPAVVTVNR